MNETNRFIERFQRTNFRCRKRALEIYLFPEDDEGGRELVLTEKADLETGYTPVVAMEESPLLPK